jgi:TetR/AcrR family transcriptional repressor of nem operon
MVENPTLRKPTQDPAADTKGALIAAAIEILGTDGWAALRTRDLAKTVGIRAPSIYHHFGTKTDLGVAVINHLATEAKAYTEEIEAAGDQLRQRLDRLVEKVVEEGSCDRSCPLYILQAEYATLPEPMQICVRELIAGQLAVISSWLDEAAHYDEIRLCCPAAVQARILWATLEHGIQLHRLLPDVSLKELIDCWYCSIATASHANEPNA